MRVLVVDDEAPARRKLLYLLANEPDLEVTGEAADGEAAVIAIREQRPDLVLLDIQMPKLGGFGVVERVGVDQMPLVVFVTAFDQYAIKAFDVHAVDYLLKPYDRQRFSQALERARAEVERRQAGDMKSQLLALLQDVEQRGPSYPERLVVKSSGRVILIKVDDLDWVDAAGNYVRLHAGNESHLLRETMGRLESRLDPDRFLRIHRSSIVNIERIKELQQQFHGDYIVVLKNGQRLTLSRSYRDKIQGLLSQSI